MVGLGFRVSMRVRQTGAVYGRTDPGPDHKPWRGSGRHETVDD
jgi:hypothetical protein